MDDNNLKEPERCEYGCDGYGPNGACSTCVGIIERDDGSFADLDGNDLSDAAIYAMARRAAIEEAARMADECSAISRANCEKEPPGTAAVVFSARRNAAADIAQAIRGLSG